MSTRSLPRSLIILSSALTLALGCGKAVENGEGIPTQPQDDDDDGGINPSTDDGDDDDDDGMTTSPPTSDEDPEASQETQDEQESEETTPDDPGETTEVLPEVKFDLAQTPDISPEEDRCTKIDFLFVVDNSLSMQDEQIHLTESFPGFITGITESAQLEDYRIMVIKSNSASVTSSSCTNGKCTCQTFGPGSGKEDCCIDRCLSAENMTCADKACDEFPENRECPDRLGTGLTTNPMGASCNVAGGINYLLPDQPDLEGAFSCLATVGTGGNSGELMIDATLRALADDSLADDGCNAGFLRDDAILVVTLITDEEEKGPSLDGSMGDPPQWKEQMLAIKDNNETALVMVGFVGDTGTPGGICKDMKGGSIEGAQPSPRLREFVSSFGDNSLLASVCADDFAPAFKEVVDKISVACDKFVPK